MRPIAIYGIPWCERGARASYRSSNVKPIFYCKINERQQSVTCQCVTMSAVIGTERKDVLNVFVNNEILRCSVRFFQYFFYCFNLDFHLGMNEL